jgi:hypothetical protein
MVVQAVVAATLHQLLVLEQQDKDLMVVYFLQVVVMQVVEVELVDLVVMAMR